ncbi:MAG: HAD family hydrolase [Candidatus Roizmanbacteria bacterium]|nr:HAD family hydrolase [Candidatus Roizmanbacteria bacterium]
MRDIRELCFIERGTANHKKVLVEKLKAISAIVFDWDGTLLDSFWAGFNAFKKMFKQYGLDITQECFQQHYSPDWHILYEKMGLRSSDWNEADLLWSKYYALEDCKLFDGALDVVRHLYSANYRIGILTGGYRKRVEKEVRQLGLKEFVSAIVFGDDTTFKKPNPRVLESVLEKLNVSSAGAMLVCDSVTDIRMGKTVGVSTIAIESGYSTSEFLAREHPDVLLRNIKELEDLLCRFSAGN